MQRPRDWYYVLTKSFCENFIAFQCIKLQHKKMGHVAGPQWRLTSCCNMLYMYTDYMYVLFCQSCKITFYLVIQFSYHPQLVYWILSLGQDEASSWGVAGFQKIQVPDNRGQVRHTTILKSLRVLLQLTETECALTLGNFHYWTAGQCLDTATTAVEK